MDRICRSLEELYHNIQDVVKMEPESKNRKLTIFMRKDNHRVVLFGETHDLANVSSYDAVHTLIENHIIGGMCDRKCDTDKNIQVIGESDSRTDISEDDKNNDIRGTKRYMRACERRKRIFKEWDLFYIPRIRAILVLQEKRNWNKYREETFMMMDVDIDTRYKRKDFPSDMKPSASAGSEKLHQMYEHLANKLVRNVMPFKVDTPSLDDVRRLPAYEFFHYLNVVTDMVVVERTLEWMSRRSDSLTISHWGATHILHQAIFLYLNGFVFEGVYEYVNIDNNATHHVDFFNKFATEMGTFLYVILMKLMAQPTDYIYKRIERNSTSFRMYMENNKRMINVFHKRFPMIDKNVVVSLRNAIPKNVAPERPILGDRSLDSEYTIFGHDFGESNEENED
jgi:hypothetical protein